MLLPRERVSFVFPNVSISRDEVDVVLYLNLTTAVKNAFTPVHLTSNTTVPLYSVLQQNVFSNIATASNM